MPMSTESYRCDVNREIKNVLIRHSVSLSEINYSFIGSTVYLYGALRKDPVGEFTPANIELLLRDLHRIDQVRNLQIDLENWSITTDVVSWIIRKRKEVTMVGQERPDHVIIDGSEKVEDVLKEIREKPEEPEEKAP